MKRILVILILQLFLLYGISFSAPRQWSADGGNDHWYECFSFGGTWGDANDAAILKEYNGMYGHLATITSPEENEFANGVCTGAAWLGGYQTAGSDEPSSGWTWVTGESWSYSKWGQGEPNNDKVGVFSGENALVIRSDGFWNDLHEMRSAGSYLVEYEYAPVPNITGITPTNTQTPTWNWSSAGDGYSSGKYRYLLDTKPNDGWIIITATSYTPESPLPLGPNKLYVQEQDDSGNWSAPGRHTIVINATGSKALNLSGPTPTTTNYRFPTWTWSSAGDGSGHGFYRCWLDTKPNDGWKLTSDTSYTPSSALPPGSHTLYVQEQDDSGNWSASDRHTIVIDATGYSSGPIKWASADGGNDHWYECFSKRGMNWGDADDAANLKEHNGMSGHLATITSPEENEFVMRVQSMSDECGSGSFFWIGGHKTRDLDEPIGGWTWVTGEILNQSSFWGWAPGEPNNKKVSSFPGENALVIRSDGYWNDLHEEDNGVISGYLVEYENTPVPNITGTTPTNNRTPTWNWYTFTGTKPDGGSGTYRYKLVRPNESEGNSWITTTVTSYTPESKSPLPLGQNKLYVQEQDKLGNWSASGSHTIDIDLEAAPSPPTVTGITPTSNQTPTWNWSSSSGGFELYRYQLDSEKDSGWTVTYSYDYTPKSPLPKESYTLYVQKRDAVGNWSISGNHTIDIDLTPPGPPDVTGPKSSDSDPQKCTWSSHKKKPGDGTFRFQFDGDTNWTTTTKKTFTTRSPKDEEITFTTNSRPPPGEQKLYVQERDAAGNWSKSGTCEIVVPLASPTGIKIMDKK